LVYVCSSHQQTLDEKKTFVNRDKLFVALLKSPPTNSERFKAQNFD